MAVVATDRSEDVAVNGSAAVVGGMTGCCCTFACDCDRDERISAVRCRFEDASRVEDE